MAHGTRARSQRGLFHPRAVAVLALSRLRNVWTALTWDNPLVWPRAHGAHPLADMEGPEYLLFAPFRSEALATEDQLAAGVALHLTGQVRDRATGGPVGDAVLDVWQASPLTGRYSRLHYGLRGRFRTDAHGRYLIHTVLPPTYRLRVAPTLDRALLGAPRRLLSRLAGGPVRFERPPHIHVLVRALDYAPLTTQLYFDRTGDRLETDIANVVRKPRPRLNLGADARTAHDGATVEFDFLVDRRAGPLH